MPSIGLGLTSNGKLLQISNQLGAVPRPLKLKIINFFFIMEIDKVTTFRLSMCLHEAGLVVLYGPRQHYRHLPYGIFPSTDAQYRYMRSRYGNLFNARFWDFNFSELFLVLEKVLGENYMECVQFSRSRKSCCLNLSLI